MPHIFALEPTEYFFSLMFLSQKKKIEKQKKASPLPHAIKFYVFLN